LAQVFSSAFNSYTFLFTYTQHTHKHLRKLSTQHNTLMFSSGLKGKGSKGKGKGGYFNKAGSKGNLAKGGDKGGLVKGEDRKKQFHDLCNKIIPVVADVIDEKGGFCSLAQINADPRIVEALSVLIPGGFPTKLKTVIDEFPDYISSFEGGRVATALGYENGHVNPDGTIVPKEKEKKEKKERSGGEGLHVKEDTTVTPHSVSMAAAAYDEQNNQARPEKTVNNLMEVSKKLQRVCSRGTAQEFEAVVNEAIQIRDQYTFTSPENAAAIIVRIIRSLEAQGKTVSMSVLASTPEITALRPSLGAKLSKFMKEREEAFIVTQDGEGPQLLVEVNPAYKVPKSAKRLGAPSAQAKSKAIKGASKGQHRILGVGIGRLPVQTYVNRGIPQRSVPVAKRPRFA